MCLRAQGDNCSRGAALSRESLDDMAGHPSGSMCVMWVPAQSSFALSCSRQLFLKLYISLWFLPSLLAILFLSLWRVSFSPQHSSPGLPALHAHPWSAPTPVHCGSHWPALWSTAGVAHCCTIISHTAGVPYCFLARIWLISFLEKQGGPGNSFWQLVSCLQSVHLCHG